MIVRNILFSVAAIALYLTAYFTLPNSNFYFSSLVNNNSIEQKKKENKRNTIQVALLLDTSGSMSGLIEQAKSQLWNILNELARTVKNGEETVLEMALYEYGNPDKSKNQHQINRLAAFTTDMDLISQKLFSLTTNGGDEYCGAIIQTSLEELEWKYGNGLKIIYIAGNEPFTQGPVPYTLACQKAKDKSITINTIYCGDHTTGINEYWQAGAAAGGGDYLNIDHDQQTLYIQTPYDDKINQLNNALNTTYIPYGSKGQLKKENQMSQDKNALSYSSANSADRAAFKSSAKYLATDWDLVDAYKKDKNILKNVKVVPDTLQNLTADELEVRIKEIAEKRSAIQQEIQELDQKRRQYKADQTSNSQESSLQKSMITTLKKQAKEKGYEINN